jgi:hypothetical protein
MVKRLVALTAVAIATTVVRDARGPGRIIEEHPGSPGTLPSVWGSGPDYS